MPYILLWILVSGDKSLVNKNYSKAYLKKKNDSYIFLKGLGTFLTLIFNN